MVHGTEYPWNTETDPTVKTARQVGSSLRRYHWCVYCGVGQAEETSSWWVDYGLCNLRLGSNTAAVFYADQG